MQRALLAASRRPALRRLVVGTPATRHVVERFVAGETLEDALAAVRALADDGIAVTLDHLGEDVTDHGEAKGTRDAYLAALDGLAGLGLGRAAEVSVKLSAFGQALPDGGQDLALELVRPVVEAASAVGTTAPRTWRTRPLSTPPSPSSPSCAAITRAPVPCFRRCCAAPRTTPARWPPP